MKTRTKVKRLAAALSLLLLIASAAVAQEMQLAQLPTATAGAAAAPGWKPIQISETCNIAPGDREHLEKVYTVPPGKLLVVEFASVSAELAIMSSNIPSARLSIANGGGNAAVPLTYLSQCRRT